MLIQPHTKWNKADNKHFVCNMTPLQCLCNIFSCYIYTNLFDTEVKETLLHADSSRKLMKVQSHHNIDNKIWLKINVITLYPKPYTDKQHIIFSVVKFTIITYHHNKPCQVILKLMCVSNFTKSDKNYATPTNIKEWYFSKYHYWLYFKHEY